MIMSDSDSKWHCTCGCTGVTLDWNQGYAHLWGFVRREGADADEIQFPLVVLCYVVMPACLPVDRNMSVFLDVDQSCTY